MKSISWKLTLSLLWLVATFSMVTWWFIYAMRFEENASVADMQRHQRMIFWEGSTLLLAILAGGIFLILYVYRDSKRHERLRFFFSNFSHDIKTSISRIRLQAEILSENKAIAGSKNLEKLLKDLTHLDLQLENSLLLTHVDEAELLSETLRLKSLIQSLQIEFDSLQVHANKDADLTVDSRAFKSILRNIFENSILHGKASVMDVQVVDRGSGKVELIFKDNGQGTKRNIADLGSAILPVKEHDGNGIGLYLAKKLMQRMKGNIEFKAPDQGGFESHLTLRGVAR